MKERNESNNNYRKIWWTLLIVGVLSASTSQQKILYDIVYKKAHDRAYDYDAAYDKACTDLWEGEFKKRGGNLFDCYIMPGYEQRHEAEINAEQIASQIATQKAETTANRTLDAGAFMAIAGLFGLLATNKKSKEL